MAAPVFWYGPALLSALNKEIDIDSDTLKVMLTTSGYTPNQDTHRYKSSVTNEVVGTGYTAGGQTLTGVSISYNSGTNTTTIDADDPTWNTSTITARWAVFYDSTPATDSTRPLLCYMDLQSDISSSAGPFVLQLNASGLITGTMA